jgi:hypothetical protein
MNQISFHKYLSSSLSCHLYHKSFLLIVLVASWPLAVVRAWGLGCGSGMTVPSLDYACLWH